MRIFVTPCSFYVLLQSGGKSTLFFRHKDAGWVTKLNCPELCSFDCCLTDRADLTVGPTLSSEKSDWVF